MRSRSSPLSRGRSNGTPVRRRREEAPIGQAGTRAQKLRASATADGEDERALPAALRDGDEAAFTGLVERHHAALTRVAMLYVRDAAVVEEVVQETWLGVLEGLHRFEGRSSLKTWMFRILTNTAKTRAARERRSVPISALGAARPEGDEPAVEPERFLDSNHSRWPGRWATPPRSWAALPEERLLAQETLARLAEAIADLAPAQREVIRLRDVEGWAPAEVCEVLGVSEGNQRVLLHRARTKVRRALERYLDDRP